MATVSADPPLPRRRPRWSQLLRLQSQPTGGGDLVAVSFRGETLCCMWLLYRQTDRHTGRDRTRRSLPEWLLHRNRKCIKPKWGLKPPYPQTKSPQSLSASGALSNTLYLSSDKLVCNSCEIVILYYLHQSAAEASGNANDHGSISGGKRSIQGGSSVVTL